MSDGRNILIAHSLQIELDSYKSSNYIKDFSRVSSLLPLPDFDTGVNAAIILIDVVDDGVLVRVQRVLDAVVVCVSCKVDDAAVGLVVPGEVIVVELHEGARRVDLRAVLAHRHGTREVGRVLRDDALQRRNSIDIFNFW